MSKYTAYRTTVPATYATHAISICHYKNIECRKEPNTEYRTQLNTEYLSTGPGPIEVRFSERIRKSEKEGIRRSEKV
jgi:hypothetical protein